MKTKIVQLLANLVQDIDIDEIDKLLEIPPKSDMGDFAFPCFRFAKTLKKAPQLIAEEFKEKIGEVDYLASIEAKGGYLNFFVDKTMLVKDIVDKSAVENYGAGVQGKGKSVCIDYSSPNVAKNFHVGHLRTTIIGNSLYKIHEKLGYKVVRINHLGDWGTQFGKLIVAYKKWGNKEAVEQKGVSELMSLYVKFHDEADEHPELNDEARDWFAKMEQGNEEALEIWRVFVDISLIEYERIYKLLGMEFDYYTGESFYRDKTQNVINLLIDKKLLVESEGANIVSLDDYDMPPCLISKKDGSTIYATRDLAAALYRKETYDFSKCLYVTGLEQKLHFNQVFKVLELMGYDWYNQMIHVPYGLVSLKEGKISTRKGQVIYAEDILHESINKIKQIIQDKNPDLEDKDDVANKVGIGAILFNDLYNQRIKDVTFSWDKILNFDGETGPYVQYTYARAASVLRKSGLTEINTDIDYTVLTDEATIALLKEISRFPKVIEDAAERLEPSVVARYSIAVAQSFNKFYHDCQILSEKEEVKIARLKVVEISKNVIKRSLELLGIGAPEQM